MTADDVDFAARRFVTDDFPERERLARWREEFGRTLVRVDIEPVEADVPFRAEAVLRKLPGAHIASCRGSSMRLHRTPALAADADDSIGLIINTGAPSLARQRDAEVVLGRGDAVFVRPDEPGMLHGADHLSIVFPRAPLATRTEHIQDAVMRPITHRFEPLLLLLGYLRLVQSEPELNEPALQQVMVGHIHDLAALVIGANRTTREEGMSAIAAARLKSAIAFIRAHFANPDLSIAAVAERQGISPRYLQALLEQSGASFTERVNELRLRRALALLTRFPGQPVSAIAAQAGFSNVSHFNRLFRLRFGDTPSGMRRRS